MKRLMNRLHKGEKGLTLIELLVVIAILGILAAVAVPLVIGFIERGRVEAADSELRAVQLAVNAAMAHQRLASINATTPRGFGADANPPITGADGGDHTVGGTTVGAFIAGGFAAVEGNYHISANGTVTRNWFPGLP
jgi:type IV pilus assembly protein PilA